MRTPRSISRLAWLSIPTLLYASACGSDSDQSAKGADAGSAANTAGTKNQSGNGSSIDAAGEGNESSGGNGSPQGGKGSSGSKPSGGRAGNAGSGNTSSGGSSNAGSGNAGSGNASSGGGPTGMAGPLRPSSNPHYFQDENGTAVMLAGSHTWNNLQDWGTGATPEPFDFTAYTNFLKAHGHNFTLLWQTEMPKFCNLPTTEGTPPDFTNGPLPWQRTGPGNASDGGPKFDLTKYDAAFFDRLRDRVTQLKNAGIWVGIYLFTGEWISTFRCASDGYPLTGSNNINAIDAGGGHDAMNMTQPNAITDIQDALANKMIDTVNDLTNVLWIVSEEASPDTMWWQAHMIAHVRAYEATKPYQHPIGLGAIGADPNAGRDALLYDSDADWVAPFARPSPATSCGAGHPACKVNMNDSDHSYFGIWNETPQQNRNYAWENFARGNNTAFMDPYTIDYPRQGRNACPSPTNGICTGPDPRWDNFRDNLGYLVRYSKKLNLAAVQPSTTLCSTQFCLAQTPATGTELLVYAPSAGAFTVDLSSAAGRTMNYEWFDPSTGTVAGTGSVAGGNAAENFTTPAAITGGDSVLYIVDSAGHG
jgi:hypothetical protein